MKILITGATGFIGKNLALYLASQNHIIHALYRSEKKVEDLKHENIKLFKGDILDNKSIDIAMKDCEQVYHIAAFTDVWTKNKSQIYDLNVKATENILKLAQKHNIKKIVFTSTASVFGFSQNNELINETSQRPSKFFIEYERTKNIAEQKIKEYVKSGLNIVIVNPTRVFGPGELSKSNSVTIIMKRFFEQRWRVIPGNGNRIGNYAFIDDVVKGHVLAMKYGKAGENYLLGGDNISFKDFFNTLRPICNNNKTLFSLPTWLMILIANLMLLNAKLLGIKPIFIPSLVEKFFKHDWTTSLEKSKSEINYKPISFNEGAKKTFEWHKSLTEK